MQKDPTQGQPTESSSSKVHLMWGKQSKSLPWTSPPPPWTLLPTTSHRPWRWFLHTSAPCWTASTRLWGWRWWRTRMRSWKPVCSNIHPQWGIIYNCQGPFRCNLTKLMYVYMEAMWALTYERSRLSSCLYPSSAKRFSPESIACAFVTLANPIAMSSPNPETL